MTRRVTLAYPLTVDGKEHKPDQTVELEDGQAAELLAYGRARVADGAKASDAEKKGK